MAQREEGTGKSTVIGKAIHSTLYFLCYEQCVLFIIRHTTNALQIEDLSLEPAPASSRSTLQLLSAFKGLKDQLQDDDEGDDNASAADALGKVEAALHSMIRALAIREEVLVNLQVIFTLDKSFEPMKEMSPMTMQLQEELGIKNTQTCVQ